VARTWERWTHECAENTSDKGVISLERRGAPTKWELSGVEDGTPITFCPFCGVRLSAENGRLEILGPDWQPVAARRWELILEREGGEQVILADEFIGTRAEAEAKANALADERDASCLDTIRLNSKGVVRCRG